MKLTKFQLANLLREMADTIEASDSFEGNLSYTCMLEGLERDEFEVSAGYRFGNQDGQGGFRLIEGSAP